MLIAQKKKKKKKKTLPTPNRISIFLPGGVRKYSLQSCDSEKEVSSFRMHLSTFLSQLRPWYDTPLPHSPGGENTTKGATNKWKFLQSTYQLIHHFLIFHGSQFEVISILEKQETMESTNWIGMVFGTTKNLWWLLREDVDLDWKESKNCPFITNLQRFIVARVRQLLLHQCTHRTGCVRHGRRVRFIHDL